MEFDEWEALITAAEAVDQKEQLNLVPMEKKNGRKAIGNLYSLLGIVPAEKQELDEAIAKGKEQRRKAKAARDARKKTEGK